MAQTMIIVYLNVYEVNSDRSLFHSVKAFQNKFIN